MGEVSSKYTEAPCSSEIAKLREENARLWVALKSYAYCRHGCSSCFCTKEARAALWKPDEEEKNA